MSREYPDRPVVGVGAVVIHDGAVLLVKRAKPPREGQWSLPGGAQELGETLAEAAHREVAEEAGIEIEIVSTIDAAQAARCIESILVRIDIDQPGPSSIASIAKRVSSRSSS